MRNENRRAGNNTITSNATIPNPKAAAPKTKNKYRLSALKLPGTNTAPATVSSASARKSRIRSRKLPNKIAALLLPIRIANPARTISPPTIEGSNSTLNNPAK